GGAPVCSPAGALPTWRSSRKMQRAQEPLITRPTSWRWRRRRARSGLLGAIGAGASLVLGILYWSHAAATPRSAYHYRFERTPRGAVKQALQGEIEFYQARLTYDPNSGLNLAAVAGAYHRMARSTGALGRCLAGCITVAAGCGWRPTYIGKRSPSFRSTRRPSSIWRSWRSGGGTTGWLPSIFRRS